MKALFVVCEAEDIEFPEFEVGFEKGSQGSQRMLLKDGAEGGQAGADHAPGVFYGRPEEDIQCVALLKLSVIWFREA